LQGFHVLKTIAFHTLGCKLNYSETSAIARKCAEKGFQIAKFSDIADIYVLNTCSVTENADKETRFLIRQVRRRNPEAKVVVMGCYAQLQPEDIVNKEQVDMLVGTKEKFRLPDLLLELENADGYKMYHGGIREVYEFHPSASVGGRTRSFLKIQDGCDYPCTYCTIPLARGKSRSGRPEEILKEIKILEDQGIKEIVLTGVNTGDYGIFEPGKKREMRLYDLLRLLEDNTHSIERIRISSIEPNLLDEDIILLVSRSEKFMPHFHIPLQSGSNEILARMKRRYRKELYAEKVNLIRKHIPHACIGMDIMVGFPGETDQHFRESVEFVSVLDVSYLHVFTFSPRPDTEAFQMNNQIPVHIKKERNSVLQQISQEKTLNFYRSELNKIKPVLIEEIIGGKAYGYTDNYIKSVVSIKDTGIRTNQIINVELKNIERNGENDHFYVGAIVAEQFF
jgi:threonylcarbamoyladenosine tRNA methylthiotransferase MtaB